MQKGKYHRFLLNVNRLLFIIAEIAGKQYVRAIQLGELFRAQKYKTQDYNDAAEAARRAKWRMSKKQKILRAFDEIEALWNKYGAWGAVLQAIKRRPPKGDYDPFRELRGERLTAHYLSSIMSEERNVRKSLSQSKTEQQ